MPVRQALASLSAGSIRRILLVTDGNENEGCRDPRSVAGQTTRGSDRHGTLNGRSEPKLKIEAVVLPAAVFTGEHFPVDLTITSPRATVATVDLTAESKQIGDHASRFNRGENHVRVRTSLNASGAIDLSGKVKAAESGRIAFRECGRRAPTARCLGIGGSRGTEGHIAAVLSEPVRLHSIEKPAGESR